MVTARSCSTGAHPFGHGFEFAFVELAIAVGVDAVEVFFQPIGGFFLADLLIAVGVGRLNPFDKLFGSCAGTSGWVASSGTTFRATFAPKGLGQSPFRISSRNRFAAVIGPIVWELDGPMPILNRSKTERNM